MAPAVKMMKRAPRPAGADAAASSAASSAAPPSGGGKMMAPPAALPRTAMPRAVRAQAAASAAARQSAARPGPPAAANPSVAAAVAAAMPEATASGAMLLGPGGRPGRGGPARAHKVASAHAARQRLEPIKFVRGAKACKHTHMVDQPRARGGPKE